MEVSMATLVSTVYSDLKNKIQTGELPPSSRLHEQELSQLYSVSRNTIKKALLMLENEGLVVIEENKGAKVRTYSMEEVLEYLDIRSCLEGFIVERAVPVITEDEIKKMEQILATMKEYYNRHELLAYSQNNQKFHKVIYDACPNRTAVNMVVALKTQMSKYNTKTILIPGRDTQSFQEHSQILQAIKNHDPEQAKQCMITHVLNVRKTFEDNYQLLF